MPTNAKRPHLRPAFRTTGNTIMNDESWNLTGIALWIEGFGTEQAIS